MPERFLGGYLSVVSVPKSLARDGEMTGYFDFNRVAMVYTADHLDDARAVFIFRPAVALDYDHRDSRTRSGSCAPVRGHAAEVDRWLAEVDHTPTFYFDAITQLELDQWSRGRVTLVGDAGYCRAPQSAAAPAWPSSAPTCWRANSHAGGDYAAAFAAYEHTMLPSVLGSRGKLASVNAKDHRSWNPLGSKGSRRHRPRSGSRCCQWV